MARRRFQRGQLAREADRWVGRWREDVEMPDGTIKRVRRWDVIAPAKGCTKPMAERKLAERLAHVNRADYRPEWAGSFALFADKWQRTVMVQHKPSTRSSERSVIRVHLVPAWGEWRCSAEVPSRASRISREPVSTKTRRASSCSSLSGPRKAPVWPRGARRPKTKADARLPTVRAPRRPRPWCGAGGGA